MNTLAAKFKLRTYKCYYCGIQIVYRKQIRGEPTPGNQRTIDHRIPSSRGGADDLQNYVESCNRCNTEKGQLTDTEYLIVLRYRKASGIIKAGVGMLLGLTIRILMSMENSA